ncbi:hypothetical protein [Streptomyces hydrogenans]|uniref:hypothetical protein n=1 Tax=Streptomyces hydrogenans TaxID=1873719 RepID=UPI00332FDA91
MVRRSVTGSRPHGKRSGKRDCHVESICESCTFFVTTIEFRPTLERHRDDAASRGQVGRVHMVPAAPKRRINSMDVRAGQVARSTA